MRPQYRLASAMSRGTRVAHYTLAGGGFRSRLVNPFRHCWSGVSSLSGQARVTHSTSHLNGAHESGLPDAADGVDEYDSLGLSGSCVFVDRVDPYAQARVTNYIRRCVRKLDAHDQHFVSVQRVQGIHAFTPQFYARVRLPVPERFGERVGEGYAPTAREAEQVAFAHAERVLDALGIPIFQLPAKQQRHADAAAESGRSAPYATSLSATPQAVQTPSPPPLQLLKAAAEPGVHHPSRVRGTECLTVGPPLTPLLQYTLASPHFSDSTSVVRIRSFFAAHGAHFQRYSRVIPSRAEVAGPHTLQGDTTLFTAQIRLPISARFGSRVCSGTAANRNEAMVLACMHAELTLDALGLALFPSDVGAQRLHAAECRLVGRWATMEPGLELRYGAATPPSLLSAGSAVGGATDSALRCTTFEEIDTVEEQLCFHSKALRQIDSYLEVEALDADANVWLSHYLGEVNPTKETPVQHPPFFVASLGTKGHETYRASLLLEPDKAAPTEHGSVRVLAVGIATSPDDAKTAAAMHARHLLRSFTPKVAGTVDAVKTGERAPQAVRYVRDHVGRIVVSGLRAAARTLDDQYAHTPALGTSVDHVAPYMGTAQQLSKDLESAQRTLPTPVWSLSPDGENRIVVSPFTSPAQHGQNYVHTLPRVREPDPMAVLRLRDYLERHGKDLDTSMQVRYEVCEDMCEVRRWVVTVVLPVPTAVLRSCVCAVNGSEHAACVAHGEAYTVKEALTMCAVHAELLVDAVGVLWYDHPMLQLKHADTARKLGRQAPLSARSIDQLRRAAMSPSALPPPVRKEHPLSPLWLRLASERQSPSGAPPQSDGNGTTVPVPCAQDDALCDLAQLRRLHTTEVFRNAVKHARFLFHSRGGDFFRAVRQYSIHTGSHGRVHRAIVELPLPAPYGVRYAVGCGPSKRLACLACAMHTLAVFGVLAVPVYNGRRQSQLASALAQRGVPCPQPGTALNATSTPSPPGFFVEAAVGAEEDEDGVLAVPEPPDPEDLHAPDGGHQMWVAYVQACKTYVAEARESAVFTAVTELHRAPRSGVAVEDEGLNVVERLPVDVHRKGALKMTCAQCCLPPPPLPFHYTGYGQLPNRLYLCEARVCGTPYRARGCGRTGQESLHRCAMHYEYLAVNTSAGAVPVQARSHINPPFARRQSGEDTAAEKIRKGASSLTRPVEVAREGWDEALTKKVQTLELFNLGRTREAVLRVSVRARPLSSHTSMRVVLAEIVESAGGESVSGRSSAELAEQASASDRARVDRGLFDTAVTRLYHTLSTRWTDFKPFALQLEAATTLDVSHLTSLGSDNTLADSLCSFLPLTAAAAVSGRDHTATTCDLHGVPLTFLPDAFFDSPLATALLQLTAARLGQSLPPPPPSYSRFTRDTLVGMGLARRAACADAESDTGVGPSVSTHLRAAHDDDSPIEATPLGVAAAFVVQCMPPLALCAEPQGAGAGGSTVAGPALPLELAKVLIGGHQLGCPDVGFALVEEVVRTVALNDVRSGAGDSPTAAEFSRVPTNHHGRFDDELRRRFTALIEHLHSHAADAALTVLLSRAGPRISDCVPAMTQLVALIGGTTEFVPKDGNKDGSQGMAAHCVVGFDVQRGVGSDSRPETAVCGGLHSRMTVSAVTGGLCGTFRPPHTSVSTAWPHSATTVLLPHLLGVALRTACDTSLHIVMSTRNHPDLNLTTVQVVQEHWWTCLNSLHRVPPELVQVLCSFASATYHPVTVREPSQFLLS